MIPVVILIRLALGGFTPRLVPVALTVALLVIVGVLWGVVVGGPWGVVVAAVNAAAGGVLGFLFVGLSAKLVNRAR